MEKRLAREIFDKLNVLLQQQAVPYELVKAVHAMLLLYIEEILSHEVIHFTTLFTKLSYLSLKYDLTRQTSYLLHRHRKTFEGLSEETTTRKDGEVSIHSLLMLICEVEKVELPKSLSNLYKVPEFESFKLKGGLKFRKNARVHIFSYEKETHQLIGFEEAFPEEKIKVQLNVVGKNDDYNSLLRFLSRRNKFPIILNLEDIEIDGNGVYTPGFLVFEPDYLMDVTTVSECFKSQESNPIYYFLKKFIPVLQNKYLIIGNIANYFLDELFYNPEISFGELVKKTFKISPLGFSMMSDIELKDVVSTLRTHFATIKQVINDQLPIHSITTENVYLEPSFYAPQYGFQGRLDLYAMMPSKKEAKIVELKSGKPFRSNTYGLNINHYVQTLLYDLMVNAVNSRKLKVSSFILYSSQSQDALRFAPPLKVQQKEAIKLRNQLVEIDYLLADSDLDNEHLFSFIDPSYIKSEGFAKRDIERFQKTYASSSSIVKKYFNAYTAFVAREQILAKTGEFGMEKSRGLAGLWLDEMHEKTDNYLVLNALKIRELKSVDHHTIIAFTRTELTAINANFRKGDLGVLYPYNAGNESVLRNQVFKCSIIEINQESVRVRLRNRQQNTSLFITEEVWHIEHDHLDHGFNAMYQDLFYFLTTDKHYQKRMLGLESPEMPGLKIAAGSDYMTEEQRSILSEMIAARDYYLLWGPPGTGKTSVMLHEYVKHSYRSTSEKLLILAYTNRAVDEICEAISRVGGGIEEQYFRIGSRYSTNEKYIDDLLVKKLEDIDSRSDLISLLQNSRVLVSTLASIHGKKEVFSLLKFDTIIVDEASQILEPHLIGLLSRAPKFILIGDHYQLPAIVRQRENESRIDDELLQNSGLSERRNSLFERLYRNSQKNNWNWCLGRLSQQGRMHEEIMDFANAHFYNGQLRAIESKADLVQESSLDRIVFIPSQIDLGSTTFKTNAFEAKIVARLVKEVVKRYRDSGLNVEEDSIGVITPYRAQISAIKAALDQLDVGEIVNVDTVERYQGTARDVIIISLCLNSTSQLKQIVSLSADGIDRKLNVAITRTRKQLYIVGNEALMRGNKVYSDLINAAKQSSPH